MKAEITKQTKKLVEAIQYLHKSEVCLLDALVEKADGEVLLADKWLKDDFSTIYDAVRKRLKEEFADVVDEHALDAAAAHDEENVFAI